MDWLPAKMWALAAMRATTLIMLCASWLAVGCGGGEGGGSRDGGADSQASLSCAEIQGQWRARVAAMPIDCETDADCAAPGDNEIEENACDCNPILADACGVGVNFAAYQADDQAHALAREFHDRCLTARCDDEVECWCDCERAAARCVVAHCEAVAIGECFPAFVDAGTEGAVDAAP
jgi:hypothetical protein